jgi:hypothetical protein
MNKIVGVVSINEYNHFVVLGVTNQLQGLGCEET